MKKLLTILLTLFMTFTLVGCNSNNEQPPVVEETEKQEEVVEPVEDEPIVGGFVDAEDKTITDELKDIFNSALEGLLGASYEPVELVATQVVAGTNYKFLANGTKTTNPVTKGTYYITIYKDLQGNVKLLDIEVVEEKQEEKEEVVDPTQYSYWVVVYDQFNNELSRSTAKYGTTVKDPDGNDVVVKGNTYFHAIVDYPSSKEDDGPTPTPTVTKYTVTFNMQDHGTQVPSQSIEKNNKVTKPVDPTVAGLIFKGWYKEPTYDNQWNFNVDTVTSNTTLYAKWAVTIGYVIGDDFPEELNAWTNGQNGTCYYHPTGFGLMPAIVFYNTEVTGSYTPLPCFGEVEKTNEGYIYQNSTYKITISFILSGDELVRIVFDADETAQDSYKADKGTYTAPTNNICTITLDPNGGTGGSDSTTVTLGASSVTAFTIPTREGYQLLDGWYTSQTGGNRVLSTDGQEMYGAESITAPTDPVTWDRTDPITLYAHWTPINFTVKFNANGGEGAMADQSFVYDAPDRLSYNSFTHPGGMTFFRWNTSQDGAGESFDAGALVENLTNEPDGVVTLYAIWQ